MNVDLIPLLDKNVEYFYKRYTELSEGKSKLRNLCFKMEGCKKKKGCAIPNCDIKTILDKKLEELTSRDKVYFLIYIISRYRNNMFHGNKNAKNWISQYKTPIEKCIRIMILLTKIDKKNLDEEIDTKNESQEITKAIEVKGN